MDKSKKIKIESPFKFTKKRAIQKRKIENIDFCRNEEKCDQFVCELFPFSYLAPSPFSKQCVKTEGSGSGMKTWSNALSPKSFPSDSLKKIAFLKLIRTDQKIKADREESKLIKHKKIVKVIRIIQG